MTKKQIEAVLESEGWSYTWGVGCYDNKYLEISSYSPAGQDLSLDIDYKSFSDVLGMVNYHYENYDPSAEAYLWLDETGHGKNGAPYDMIDVYNDMVACKAMIKKLYEALKKVGD